MSDEDRKRYGYGPNIAISRASVVFDRRIITLDSRKDAAYFEAGQEIEFGLWDDGTKQRDERSRVRKVDRENGVVELDWSHPSLANGDFIFTSPPGLQLDSPWAKLREAKENEREWLRQVGERLIAMSKGGRGE